MLTGCVALLMAGTSLCYSGRQVTCTDVQSMADSLKVPTCKALLSMTVDKDGKPITTSSSIATITVLPPR